MKEVNNSDFCQTTSKVTVSQHDCYHIRVCFVGSTIKPQTRQNELAHPESVYAREE
jgi:hypothetical protein